MPGLLQSGKECVKAIQFVLKNETLIAYRERMVARYFPDDEALRAASLEGRVEEHRF